MLGLYFLLIVVEVRQQKSINNLTNGRVLSVKRIGVHFFEYKIIYFPFIAVVLVYKIRVVLDTMLRIISSYLVYNTAL